MRRNRSVAMHRVTTMRGIHALIAMALLACSAIAQTPASTAPPPEIPKVSVVTPVQRDITSSIKLPGALVPDEQVSVYSKIAGYVEEIAVDEGDTVEKNQVIVKLSAPEMEPELALAEAKVRAAQARVASAQASAELNATVHQRLEKLHAAEPGAVTVEDVDEAAARNKIGHANVQTAEAEHGVALAEVKRLKSMTDYLTVRAPFTGSVTRRFADQGAFVAAGSNASPILEITRLDKLRLAFDLPERLAPFVQKGTALRYSVTALPGKVFEGSVARRTDALVPETRSMRAEVDIDNADKKLAPGMYASIQIPLNGVAGVSILPASALRTIDGRPCVFVVEGDSIRKAPVESLLDEGPEVVVAGQLNATDRIVSQGPASLADGQKVDIKEGN